MIQAVGFRVWQNAHRANPKAAPTVQPEDVDAAIDIILDAGRDTFEWLWNGLGAAERAMMSALAQAGPGPVSDARLAEVFNDNHVTLLARDLRNVPRLLVERDFCDKVDAGYYYRVELLRRWVKQYQPLNKLNRELESLRPTAENLYQTAHGYFENGNMDRAIDLLHESLRFDPLYQEAIDLLANILIITNRFDEAEQVIEPLYDYRPAWVRPLLVWVYLSRLKVATDDDERIALCEKVLRLEQSHPQAVQEKDKILWRRKGHAALLSRDWSLAEEAFMKGDDAEMLRLVEKKKREDLQANRFTEGYSALKKGDWDRAIAAFHWVVSQTPAHEANHELALSLMEQAVENSRKKRTPKLSRLFEAISRRGRVIAVAGGVIAVILGSLLLWRTLSHPPQVVAVMAVEKTASQAALPTHTAPVQRSQAAAPALPTKTPIPPASPTATPALPTGTPVLSTKTPPTANAANSAATGPATATAAGAASPTVSVGTPALAAISLNQHELQAAGAWQQQSHPDVTGQ